MRIRLAFWLMALLLAVFPALADADDALAETLTGGLRPAGELIVTYTPFNQTEPDKVYVYPGSPDQERNFALRKASLGAEGPLYYDWLRAKVTASAEQEADGELVFGLETAYLQVAYLPDRLKGSGFEPTHGATIGAQKIPFTRQYLTSESALQFINRALVVEETDIRRDLGATFDARYDIARGTAVFRLNAGAFNGRGHRVYAPDNNSDLLYAARLRVDLLSPMAEGEGDARESFLTRAGRAMQLSRQGPQISLGGDYFQNNDLDRVVKGWSADAELRWMGLSVLGEYIFTRYEPDLDEDLAGDVYAKEWETVGWYVQGGFFVWPRHLELAGRYEEYRVDRLNELSPIWHLAHATAGVNFHAAGDHRLKFSANFVRRLELEGLPVVDDDTISVQASLRF